MELKINSSAISWMKSSYASSNKMGGYKVFAAYTNLSKCNVLNQIQDILKEKKLPTKLTVSGKKNLSLKLDCYQDDGFWFRQLEPNEGKLWRIWVPSKDLLTGKKIIKNVT